MQTSAPDRAMAPILAAAQIAEAVGASKPLFDSENMAQAGIEENRTVSVMLSDDDKSMMMLTVRRTVTENVTGSRHLA